MVTVPKSKVSDKINTAGTTRDYNGMPEDVGFSKEGGETVVQYARSVVQRGDRMLTPRIWRTLTRRYFLNLNYNSRMQLTFVFEHYFRRTIRILSSFKIRNHPFNFLINKTVRSIFSKLDVVHFWCRL